MAEIVSRQTLVNYHRFVNQQVIEGVWSVISVHVDTPVGPIVDVGGCRPVGPPGGIVEATAGFGKRCPVRNWRGVGFTVITVAPERCISLLVHDVVNPCWRIIATGLLTSYHPCTVDQLTILIEPGRLG